MESLFPLRFPACGVSPPPCLLRPGTRTLRVSSTLRYIPPPPRATDACPVDLSWEGGEVDVIGIGSRKDAIIDFCLASPSPPSSRLRFWTIQSRDSTKVQLLHKSSAKEMDSLTVNCPLQFSARCPGIILVATAGHVPDDEIAFQLLNGVKSTGGLSIAILLKPFSFEGQRRLLEVNNLMGKLQNCSHLYIVVEVDALPKTKEETLEEAVKSVNYAVSMAINLISSLMTDKQTKFLDQPNEQVKELRFAEILEVVF